MMVTLAMVTSFVMAYIHCTYIAADFHLPGLHGALDRDLHRDVAMLLDGDVHVLVLGAESFGISSAIRDSHVGVYCC